jgi:hypothetical protein
MKDTPLTRDKMKLKISPERLKEIIAKADALPPHKMTSAQIKAAYMGKKNANGN